MNEDEELRVSEYCTIDIFLKCTNSYSILFKIEDKGEDSCNFKFYLSRRKRATTLTLGWNAIAVTKSICWKQQRHSLLDMCHNLTVLSIEEESKK